VTIGWLIGAFSIAQLIAAPVWGRVSDRYGRRPALVIGLTASAIAFLVFGLATTVWLLFLSRLIQGAGGGTTGVARPTWRTRSALPIGPRRWDGSRRQPMWEWYLGR
jgi:MFS family permease